MGRLAFTEADRQMGAINMTSAMIDSKVCGVHCYNADWC